MENDADILIAGAGPAGLACALGLLGRGVKFRIAERRTESAPRVFRRGLILRPRTLAMLEEFGLAEPLIAEGQKLSLLKVEEDGRVLARFDLSAIKSPTPFLLCIPEEGVISVFTSAICARGGTIERGLAVTNVRVEPDGRTKVHFSDGSDACYTHVVGADGLNSAARTALGIPFTGYDYPGGWFFADEYVEADPHSGVLTLLPGGGMRLNLPLGGGQVRSVSTVNFDDAVNLPVAIRQVQGSMRAGVRLTGTAAAAHGPFGGIGMSREIEDALSLARSIAQKPESAEVSAEINSEAATLELAETVFRGGRIKNRAGRFFRAYVLFLCARVPSFRRRVLRALTGLA